VTVGPDIRNLAGQPMDQDQDGVPGEGSDAYAGSFGLIGRSNFAATGLPLGIVAQQTTISSINIASDFLITQLTVQVNIAYKNVSDLIIQLVSPSGMIVTLSNQRGGAGRNYYYTVFSDAARLPISQGRAPFMGSYRPDEPLSVFNYRNAKGIWQLRVIDVGIGNQGTLKSWLLILRGVPGDASGPPA
jgi:subtilisin-like proprotein convertase family protein